MIVVGNPANRRVTMFQAALVAQGHPPARVIAWRDLAESGAPAFAELDGLVRIDSAGEDDDVERAFLRLGEMAAREAGFDAIDAEGLAEIPRTFGRILYPRQQHLGFLAVLEELERARKATTRMLPPPSAVRLLFDKSATHALCSELEIPVPESLPTVTDPDELREVMRRAGFSSVFVKLTSGSSASCLAVFVHGPRGEHVITTVEDTGAARFNTRKLQRLADRAQIDRTLGFILREGAHVERSIPKAKLGGRYCDLRVLVIDGEPAFVVPRTSPHPITNLHLGGQRGDLAQLRACIPTDAWERAMESCVKLQRASGAFHVGIDLMFEPGWRDHRIIEGNAFGDLLPNLERDGLDVYGWQIRRLYCSKQ
ncbi:MAG: STM4014 family protein [Polyangiales bacterium]